MNNAEYAINKLKECKLKSSQLDFITWLNSTYAVFEESFQHSSQRVFSFKSLLNQFELKSIYKVSSEVEYEYRNRARQYIDDAIQYLSDQIILQEEEAQKKESQLVIIIRQLQQQIRDLQTAEANRPKPVTPPPEIITKIRYPFNFPLGVWIAIITGVISATAYLSYNFGYTKFDKEKLQYYQQVQTLTLDTTILHKKINNTDSLLKVKTDSLSHLNKTIEGLSLLLAKENKLNP